MERGNSGGRASAHGCPGQGTGHAQPWGAAFPGRSARMVFTLEMRLSMDGTVVRHPA